MLPSVVTWANWDRLYLDTSLWEAPVRHVLSRLGFSVISVEAGFPGTSAVFKAMCSSPRAESLIVKFYPPMVHRDFVAEQCVYQALSPHPPFPIPRLVATGVLRDAIEWPYIILEENCGIAVRDVRKALTPADLRDIAAQVGSHLGALHKTGRNQVPDLDHSISRWQTLARSRLEAAPQEVKQAFACEGMSGLPAKVLTELEAFLRSTGMAVVESMTEDDLCLIHADLTEDHVLVVPRVVPQSGQEEPRDPSRRRVETIFDFGDSEVAPVYYEWIPVWYSLLQQDEPAFLALLEQHAKSGAPEACGAQAHRSGFSLRDILLTFTFIHRFGAQTVREITDREHVAPGEVTSFGALADILLPRSASR